MSQHRRTVAIALEADALHRLLGLPDYARIIGVTSGIDPVRTTVLLQLDEPWTISSADTVSGDESRAPRVPHPVHSPSRRVRWVGWTLGVKR